AARLGLTAALASPLGDDPEGRFVRDALAAEGVQVTPRTAARQAVTAVLPIDGERAMVTFDPENEAAREDVERFAPRAAVVSVPRAGIVPDGARLYATIGDADARAYAGEPLPHEVEQARALIVNAREARLLTGFDDPERAALALAERVPRAVVTLGPGGAVTAAGTELERVAGFAVGDPVDTTGAGDLFTAAYVCSDLSGGTPEECLRWACLAAGLSVRVPTAVAGAQSKEQLAAAGIQHGLAVPGWLTHEEEDTGCSE
ncbi:MAG TPA: carbohydrate kinase family protein, partial [Solirubrobacteraceae bacterium]|nr:carbohydrate kinase family protein [Solirubrobacteraceae bacterium]